MIISLSYARDQMIPSPPSTTRHGWEVLYSAVKSDNHKLCTRFLSVNLASSYHDFSDYLSSFLTAAVIAYTLDLTLLVETKLARADQQYLRTNEYESQSSRSQAHREHIHNKHIMSTIARYNSILQEDFHIPMSQFLTPETISHLRIVTVIQKPHLPRDIVLGTDVELLNRSHSCPVIYDLQDLQECKSRRSPWSYCFNSSPIMVQNLLRPLIDPSYQKTLIENRMQTESPSAPADHVVVLWDLVDGYPAKSYRNMTAYLNIHRYISQALSLSTDHLSLPQTNILLKTRSAGLYSWQNRSHRRRYHSSSWPLDSLKAMANVTMVDATKNLSRAVEYYRLADIVVTSGFSVCAFLALFDRPHPHRPVIVQLPILRVDTDRYFLVEGRSIRASELGIIHDPYPPDVLLEFLEIFGVVDRVRGSPQTLLPSNMLSAGYWGMAIVIILVFLLVNWYIITSRVSKPTSRLL